MSVLTNPTIGRDPAIFFYTDGVDALGRFYVDVLGFKILQGQLHFDAPGHSYWLDAGGSTLVLHQSEKYLPGPYDQHGNSTLVWIQTGGTPNDVVARLVDHGCEIVFHDADPESRNHRTVVFRDIEGRPVGLGFAPT